MCRRPVLLLLTCVLAGCKKEKPSPLKAPPIDLQRFYNCDAARSRDSLSTVRALAGTWSWTKYAGAWDPETYQADRPVQLLLQADGRYFLVENGRMQTAGTWTLQQTPGGGWLLHPSEQSIMAQGLVLLCGEDLLLSSSGLDGYDYQYERLD